MILPFLSWETDTVLKSNTRSRSGVLNLFQSYDHLLIDSQAAMLQFIETLRQFIKNATELTQLLAAQPAKVRQSCSATDYYYYYYYYK
jgi:hypothetical protein